MGTILIAVLAVVAGTATALVVLWIFAPVVLIALIVVYSRYVPHRRRFR